MPPLPDWLVLICVLLPIVCKIIQSWKNKRKK